MKEMENNSGEETQFLASFKNHASKLMAHPQTNIEKILDSREIIRRNKAKPIIHSIPIIKHKDVPFIFPNTINVIQGQAGVHKSRLAEHLCAALLKKHDCNNSLIGFERTNFDANYNVLYVDTERNIMEQFPLALQSILKKAGYNSEENPVNFDFISLLQIKRDQRFNALEEYLQLLRNSTALPLFIILDVSTDCIEDFNRTDSSLQLIDMMNNAIIEHNVVFVCLIHENPKSDKARGHFGTELMNKASTVIQISRENSREEINDIFKISYLKTRSIKTPAPFHIKYCQNMQGLVCLNESEINEVYSKKLVSENIELFDLIKNTLTDLAPMKKCELKSLIHANLKYSQRTIERRIKDIIENKAELIIAEISYNLIGIGKYYQLVKAGEHLK